MNFTFEDFSAQLDYLSALRVIVLPDGRFSCPSEAEGRMQKLSDPTLKRLAMFLRGLADRIDHECKGRALRRREPQAPPRKPRTPRIAQNRKEYREMGAARRREVKWEDIPPHPDLAPPASPPPAASSQADGDDGTRSLFE